MSYNHEQTLLLCILLLNDNSFDLKLLKFRLNYNLNNNTIDL